MDFLWTAAPGAAPIEAWAVLIFGLIRIVAFGALGTVAVGFLMSCLCDLLDCRKLRQFHSGTETWRLMH